MIQNHFLDNDLIIARASAVGRSALAIIRVSGFNSITLFQNIFTKKLDPLEPRKIYLSNIVNENMTVDQVTFVFYSAPASYTGENLLEIFCHGNDLIVNNIINLFCSKFKARGAAPGEFSFRAIRNKKLSLSQVEGLDLVLNSQSSLLISKGFQALNGHLNDLYVLLRERFIELKASLEILIDFSEDVGDENALRIFNDKFRQFSLVLDQLLLKADSSLQNLTQPTIVLAGPVNSGKSTLFNKFLKFNRSIVSNIPGTTRDYVSESVFIEDTYFKIIDTAGIRTTSDLIEEEGIKSSISLLKDSFYKILLINPTQSELVVDISPDHYDLLILTHLDSNLFDKCVSNLKLSGFSFDNVFSVSLLNDVFKSYGPIGPNILSNYGGSIGPSLMSGSIGPENFSYSHLLTIIHKKYKTLVESDPILFLRHKEILKKIKIENTLLSEEIAVHLDLGVVSESIKSIDGMISELIGIITPDEVLSSIFSNFCIGK
jgi:tRNA modification GTPase